jgi:hypothetical protein
MLTCAKEPISVDLKNFIDETRKRMILSCLVPMILNHLNTCGLISPKMLITLIKKRFNVQLSPGTVYPVFNKLEKDGFIKRIPKVRNKFYSLSSKGQNDMQFLLQNSNYIELIRLI